MRVSDIKPFGVVKEDLQSSLSERITSIIKPKIDAMPKWKLRILSKGYMYAMFVMFLTIIIGLIMYLFRSSIIGSFTRELKEKVGDFEVYREGLIATNLVTPEGPAKISKAIHHSLRPGLVPRYARIIRTIPGIKGVTNKQTDFISNAVIFRWEEGYGRDRTVYYYTQAMLIVGTDFLNEFEFDIQLQSFGSKIFRREKLQLDNAEFEKKFSILRNDELAIRQCFTPLIQENYVFYAKDVQLSNLAIRKIYDEVVVTWRTSNDYLVVKSNTMLDASLNGIVKGIIQNILTDISQIYTSLAYVLSLPLFKPERSKRKELGSEQSQKRISRSKIIRMAKKAFIADAIQKRK